MLTPKNIRWERIDNKSANVGYVGNIPLFEYFLHKPIDKMSDPLPWKLVNRLPGHKKFIYCRDPKDAEETAEVIFNNFMEEITEEIEDD
jgi:hypothetical protein